MVLLLSGCSWLETVPHGKGKVGYAIQPRVSVVASPFKVSLTTSVEATSATPGLLSYTACPQESHPTQEGAGTINHRIMESQWFGWKQP